jgi:hypothetical protein
VAGLAGEFGLCSQIRVSEPDPDFASYRALWALMARNPEILEHSIGSIVQVKNPRKPIVWTDDRSNLFEVLW